MKEPRTPKQSDQEYVKKAVRILNDLLEDLAIQHLEIETTLWYSAFWCCIAKACINSGFNYSDFCEMINEMLETSEKWFEDES